VINHSIEEASLALTIHFVDIIVVIDTGAIVEGEKASFSLHKSIYACLDKHHFVSAEL
jgi:hypothetical protein